ncbi:MAG: flagellar basal body rod protein FlgC [Nitrosomonadales bacterium]|nr:MAG: flagellar basal body rod protein FlgC [Nitrosomonadales bacterium]
MSLFNVFNIAGSAMTAQSMRLNVVASNMANADSVTSSNGEPYHARQVVFQAKPLESGMPKGVNGVAVQKVIDDPAPMKLVYDPNSPFANGQGYVSMPNVNVVEEMANMISASRAYQANVEMMNTAKTMIQRTLALGQ